jgi:hypothetical protein
VSANEQLAVGLAAGLSFCALLRWTPLARDLLAAMAAAGLLQLFIANPTRDSSAARTLAGRLSREILSHPDFNLGLALAVAGVFALLCISRSR